MKLPNNRPWLLNSGWQGLVGKGGEGEEPPIGLDQMLDLTAAARYRDVVKFDGMDAFAFDPHIEFGKPDSYYKRIAAKFAERGLIVVNLVAPVWPWTQGGAAMGTATDRENFVKMIEHGCKVGKIFREEGVRPEGGCIRMDTATGLDKGVARKAWDADPTGSRKVIGGTFKEAGKVAQHYGEKLASETEVWCVGQDSPQKAHELMEEVDMPGVVGHQTDFAHMLTSALGLGDPKDALLKDGFSREEFLEAWAKIVSLLLDWTLDTHISQNDGTVNRDSSHITGRHCLPDDPEGKIDLVEDAGPWMEGFQKRGQTSLTWDGCGFKNTVILAGDTASRILKPMVQIRDRYGWYVAS